MHVYLAARHVALSDEIRGYVEHHLLEPIADHNGLEVIRTEVQLFSEGPPPSVRQSSLTAVSRAAPPVISSTGSRLP